MLAVMMEDMKPAGGLSVIFTPVRKPLPFDTTLLNYNWQIWNTKAFSIYAGHTSVIDEERLLNVAAGRAGIFVKMKQAGDEVYEGEVMARILPASPVMVSDTK